MDSHRHPARRAGGGTHGAGRLGRRVGERRRRMCSSRQIHRPSGAGHVRSNPPRRQRPDARAEYRHPSFAVSGGPIECGNQGPSCSGRCVRTGSRRRVLRSTRLPTCGRLDGGWLRRRRLSRSPETYRTSSRRPISRHSSTILLPSTSKTTTWLRQRSPGSWRWTSLGVPRPTGASRRRTTPISRS